MPVRRLSTAAGNCIDSSPSAVFLAAAGSIPAAWSRRLRCSLPIGWPWIELGNTNSRSSAAPPIRRTRRSATAARAAAIGELHPERTVLADAPTSSRGGWNRDTVRAEYEQDRRARTFEELRRTRPHYSEQDACAEARAAELFDPDTAAASASANGGSWPVAAAHSLSVLYRAIMFPTKQPKSCTARE